MPDAGSRKGPDGRRAVTIPDEPLLFVTGGLAAGGQGSASARIR